MSIDRFDSLLYDDAFARGFDRFLETRLESFSVEDALKALKRKCTEENIADVEGSLLSSPLAFWGYFGKERHPRWLTRAGLFTGKEFAVRISKMEIASGIFIPASRCIPFANPRFSPSEWRFYSGNKALPQIVVEANLEEVAPLYALLGEEYAPQIVALDDDEGESALGSAAAAEVGESFPLKVIDMREFYWQRQARPGDYLVFKVKDWRASRFSVSLRRQDEDAKGVEEWRLKFWRFLEESFKEDGPCASIEEQLAAAFFYGRDELFALPPDDILSAIERSPDIRFFDYGMETRLWKGGVNFPVAKDWEAWLEIVLCGDESNIFRITGFPAEHEVIHSYIRDAFWRKEEDCSALVERLRKANGGKTEGKRLEALNELLSQVYYLVNGMYNVFDDIAAKLRSRFLDFHLRIVSLARFCQSAQAEPESLNTQAVIMLTQLASHVVFFLSSIARVVAGDEMPEMPPPESLAGMDEALSELELTLKSEAENFRSSRKRGKRFPLR